MEGEWGGRERERPMEMAAELAMGNGDGCNMKEIAIPLVSDI